MKKILLLLLIFVSGCTGVFAQQFDYGKIAPHPRLLLPAGGEEAIRKAIAEYSPLAAVHSGSWNFATGHLRNHLWNVSRRANACWRFRASR